MFDNLKTAYRRIVGSLRVGSGRSSGASNDLARRTEGEAACLRQTAAAIASVASGRSAAAEAVQAIGRASESALGLASGIEGFDRIAAQIRILSVKAAIEAERTGDPGFAVVADLVSALALRAEADASSARDRLALTQSEIAIALQVVRKVDGALTDITGDVGQVAALLATTVQDQQAQSAAISEITAALGARVVPSPAPHTPNGIEEWRGTDYGSTRPLPAAAIAALVRKDPDWNDF